MIFLGADHGGFELKEKIKGWLHEWGEEFEDLGAHEFEPEDDYPDFGLAVGQAVVKKPTSFGILICRNGVGMDLAANKVAGVRCALGFDAIQINHARNDDHVNVLSLPAEFLSEEEAKKIVRFFLESKPSNELRFLRRLEKVAQIEKER